MKAGEHFPIKILTFDQLESTNSEAERLARVGESAGTVVVAAEQTAGKGRYRRRWNSPPGLGLWFSVILRPEIEIKYLNLINLTTALAVCDFCNRIIQRSSAAQKIPIKLKWPNDIMFDQRKLCGILLESGIKNSTLEYVVVGIGLNVNHRPEDFPEELRERAVSLRELTGGEWNLKNLLDDLLAFYFDEIEQALHSGYKGIIKRYEEQLLFMNQPVRIELQDKTVSGIIRGIDQFGYLRLESEGREQLITAGDVWGHN